MERGKRKRDCKSKHCCYRCIFRTYLKILYTFYCIGEHCQIKIIFNC
jgi:hypothetical protein